MKPKILGAAILASLAAYRGVTATMTLPPIMRDGFRLYFSPGDAWGRPR